MSVVIDINNQYADTVDVSEHIISPKSVDMATISEAIVVDADSQSPINVIVESFENIVYNVDINIFNIDNTIITNVYIDLIDLTIDPTSYINNIEVDNFSTNSSDIDISQSNDDIDFGIQVTPSLEQIFIDLNIPD